jgi:predicted ATPase/class 3 adenylate cyclase
VDSASGTVTFLFTDIEGSTRLWQFDEGTMRIALARHDEVLQSVIRELGGTVFSTMGDGMAAAFPGAVAAVAAAVAVQTRLHAEPWATAEPIRVRIGLHSGEADVRDGDYFGTAVNRSARVMAIAHGGQVVCTGTTAGLVGDRLPAGVRLLDLGPHRLRDLSWPEQIHQVVVPGLPQEFPRLRSLDALPGNLPIQPTAFIGREREVKELADAILSARIVTLTGVGGVGKTRLALQAAAEVATSFGDGAWLVELAGVGSADAVKEAVTSALGLPTGSIAAEGGLSDLLRSKEILLVLDNCEHLLTPVASLVDDVIRNAADVRVLATSREGLGVAGEHLWAVASLELPDPREEAAAVMAVDAVRLFLERAREATATFQFSDENATDIAELCRRLDGIPLAIELAAARVPALTPAEIRSHLDHRFKLLTGGRRSAVPRHQTLRSAVEWSYQLLDPEERRVLERLSVFAGDFDLSAAQAVASSGSTDPFDVLDILVRLVAKSLVVADPKGGVTRYGLLETIREYAWEQLGEHGDIDEVARCHARFFAEFARAAGAGLRGTDEAEWRERVESELYNLRSALSWAISTGESDLALQPVADLAVFGDRVIPYGMLAEDAARVDEDHPLAAVALGAACFAASLQGDVDRAARLAEEARRRADALDRNSEGLWVRCRVANGCCIAVATQGGYLEFGRRWLADARELGDAWSICEALTFMIGGHDMDEAIVVGEEALTLARTLAPSRVSFAAVMLAGRLAESDPKRSEELLLEAEKTALLSRNDWAEYTTPTAMALGQIGAGNRRGAAETLVDAIERWTPRGLPGTVMQFVSMLACVLHLMGDHEAALVMAEWAEERGMNNQVNAYWDPFGTAELAAFREGLSAADRERAVRVSSSLDDAGMATFARERVTSLHTPGWTDSK